VLSYRWRVFYFWIGAFWLVLKVTFHSIKCWHVEGVFCSLDSYPYILIISHKKKCILTMIWNENVIKTYSFHTPEWNSMSPFKPIKSWRWEMVHHGICLYYPSVEGRKTSLWTVINVFHVIYKVFNMSTFYGIERHLTNQSKFEDEKWCQKDNTNISHDAPFLIFNFWLVWMVTLNSIKRGHFDDSGWHEKHWWQVKERSFYPLNHFYISLDINWKQ
jgi:hypothetical protein